RELIEEFRLHDLQPGLEQFGPYRQRHDAAHDEHPEDEGQGERAEALVFSGREPATNACGVIRMRRSVGVFERYFHFALLASRSVRQPTSRPLRSGLAAPRRL